MAIPRYESPSEATTAGSNSYDRVGLVSTSSRFAWRENRSVMSPISVVNEMRKQKQPSATAELTGAVRVKVDFNVL